VDPRAIVGWAARVSSVANVSHATAADVASVFSFDRVSREPITVPNDTDEFVARLGEER
jgi:hypothetical protein